MNTATFHDYRLPLCFEGQKHLIVEACITTHTFIPWGQSLRMWQTILENFVHISHKLEWNGTAVNSVIFVQDLCGSDHFPVLIQSSTQSPAYTNPSWKLSKADWVTFSEKVDSELGHGYALDSDDPVAHFTSTLISVAQATIPKSKNRSVKHETLV